MKTQFKSNTKTNDRKSNGGNSLHDRIPIHQLVNANDSNYEARLKNKKSENENKNGFNTLLPQSSDVHFKQSSIAG